MFVALPSTQSNNNGSFFRVNSTMAVSSFSFETSGECKCITVRYIRRYFELCGIKAHTLESHKTKWDKDWFKWYANCYFFFVVAFAILFDYCWYNSVFFLVGPKCNTSPEFSKRQNKTMKEQKMEQFKLMTVFVSGFEEVQQCEFTKLIMLIRWHRS